MWLLQMGMAQRQRQTAAAAGVLSAPSLQWALSVARGGG